MTSALPLALAAGIYPLGLAIVLRYLGEPASMRHAYAYLAGTATVTFVAGIAILLALRGSGLTERQHPAPGGGIQVFLGVALLFVAVRLTRRRKRAGRDASRDTDRLDRQNEPSEPGKETGANGAPGRHPGLGRVYLLGVVTYLPSLLYISAIKNLADSHSSNTETALLLLLCAVFVLQMVELPIILRIVAPARTGAILAAYNGWMHRHGQDLLILLAAAGGGYVLISGIMTLLD
ncbi:GAP family protein [Frankia sp. Cj5]|uniref:GAP family protein n=2 Tax=unclassified Frankia TaxID=2632575 RepID=UPI001EF64DDA|nr:GAP family protein [Frankia sp. Cj5]